MLERRRLLSVGVGLATVALAGCADDGTDPEDGDSATPTPEPGLSIAELVFCAAKPSGYDSYERQPEATYATDETVWVYLEIDGVASRETDDGIEIDLREDVLVTDPDGTAVIEDTLAFDQTFEPGTDMETFFVTNRLTLPEGPVLGDYEFQADFSDEIGDSETQMTGTFTVTE